MENVRFPLTYEDALRDQIQGAVELLSGWLHRGHDVPHAADELRLGREQVHQPVLVHGRPVVHHQNVADVAQVVEECQILHVRVHLRHDLIRPAAFVEQSHDLTQRATL